MKKANWMTFSTTTPHENKWLFIVDDTDTTGDAVLAYLYDGLLMFASPFSNADVVEDHEDLFWVYVPEEVVEFLDLPTLENDAEDIIGDGSDEDEDNWCEDEGGVS